MRDFDTHYRDFPDFLQSTTRSLWQDRGLGSALRSVYHPDMILRSPQGIGFGSDAVAVEILQSQVAFPDQSLMTEDVIWTGSPQVGMLGSQRILTVASHRGDGGFGRPDGTRIRYREIADRYAKNNVISEEWRVRDTGGILKNLGQTPEDWARSQIPRLRTEAQPFRPAIDTVGPYTGRGNANQWGEAFSAMLEQVMEGGFSAIPDQYDAACHLIYPGDTEAHGVAAADEFWLGLRAALPSAEFVIHHKIGMEEPLMPPRAAIRWSLTGRHEGWGAFGAPSGAQIHVMGISHAEFGPGGLRREWTLFDEAAVWLQILLQVD